MNQRELARQQRKLMIVRLATITTLLISVYAIELHDAPELNYGPLFSLAAAGYGLVALYALLYRFWAGRPALLWFQLIGDAGVISGFVAITGGPASPMSFLYLLPIGVGAMSLYRRGGIGLALICWSLYAGVVLFQPIAPLAASGGYQDPGRLWYALVVHLLGMIAVALLCSYLSERIRAQGTELAERRGAVHRLQALNENIIGSINSGLITTDLSGSINFLNRGGREITGYRLQDLNGTRVHQMLDLDPEFLERVQPQLARRQRLRFERFFRTADGRTIFLGVAVSSLSDRSGEAIGYLFIFQDVTDVRSLEQEVRLKERMAALGQMAAGMAHELRNPLAAMSGAVQYLKGSLRPEGETLELMDIILRESQRLDQAIRDFLTFARPGKFAATEADLVRLIDDSVKLLRKSSQFVKGHDIVTEHDADEIHCEVDVNRMKQVFWNLATNALKAMPHGGALRIGVGIDGERIKVRFADEGVGMTDQQKMQYFQPFASSFEEGTGLGAAIVYRLVEEHGGKIEVDTSLESGTSVTIDLPRRTSTAGNQSSEPLVSAGGLRA
ncbi:hypothetical protein ABI59_01350 [Acidobacteria bacterium Mor1]|nr:hypothetical protein ABI59_01350 [Acidobacteria bacterium Mor1]